MDSKANKEDVSSVWDSFSAVFTPHVQQPDKAEALLSVPLSLITLISSCKLLSISTSEHFLLCLADFLACLISTHGSSLWCHHAQRKQQPWEWRGAPLMPALSAAADICRTGLSGTISSSSCCSHCLHILKQSHKSRGGRITDKLQFKGSLRDVW